MAEALGEEMAAATDTGGPRARATDRTALYAAVQRDLDLAHAQGDADGLSGRALSSAKRGLATLAHEELVGAILDAEEHADLVSLLGEGAAGQGNSLVGLEAALRSAVDSPDQDALGRERMARYFVRRFHRGAKRREPLMGELYDRFPQALETR
jgi:hypothetical protein